MNGSTKDRLPKTFEGRFALISGLAFLALLAAVFALANVFPATDFPSVFAAPTEIRRFFSDNRSWLGAQGAAESLAGIALLVFAASATRVIGLVANTRALLLRVAFAGGILASAFIIVSSAAIWTLSRPGIGDGSTVVLALHNLAYQAGGPAHVISVSVFLTASSVAIFGSRAAPRTLGWLGIAGGSVSALAPLAMYWKPATYLLPLSRVLLGAWILGLCLLILSLERAVEFPGGDVGGSRISE